MKLLIRGTNWIGDSVMSIPGIRLLRAAIPEAEITLATPGWARGIFEDADFIERSIEIDTESSSPTAVRKRSKLISGREFDIGLLFTNSFSSALELRMAGIPRRFGYSGEARGFLLTDSIAKPAWRGERHEVYYYLEIAQCLISALGREIPDIEPDVSVSVSDARRARARETLKKAGAEVGKRIVVIGAGSQNSRAKRWMPERFAEVADELIETERFEAVLIGSEGDRPISDQVSGMMKSRVTDLTGETDLDEAVAIIGEADLLISNDMGLAHIASAVSTPVVTIFGPTNHLTTAPWKGDVVREPVDCSPCMLRDCPIDHRCMTRVSTDMVMEAALNVLRKD
ncbi:MAG: lipopolysaccharide heptosyltransferase II [Acidobacteria bacterium]|nr:MAG: lipopolysaccharide heptosyltransferase II [Acidobacteriota bacterium]REK02276.1 MAG: lipopolysaccharide heptosyltransferase II [Acidobacteriota bacterium]REK13921.1 MAG: lipopolysaccharide heptosyltransferase II [Acidobacteriota bacterium]REK41915.1 MAG: lipopolysaccharide heptosyltransferase II [Acidobacteriota bacterium]